MPKALINSADSSQKTLTSRKNTLNNEKGVFIARIKNKLASNNSESKPLSRVIYIL